MNFIFKMAWRDSRASRRHLLFYSLSIVLGIAALVAIGSFRDALRRGVEEQSKGLLGADLAVTSRSALTGEARAFLTTLGGEQARETMFSSMVVFPTRGGRTRLVQVRALEGGFPFYGDLVTAPADAFARLREGDFAVMEETLLAQFGVRVGDPVRIGEATFTVAGALRKIPGESPAVTMLAPRVYIPLRAVEATQLVQPGSLVRYKTYFKFASGRDVEALVDELRGRFRALRLRFDTVEERKRDMGRTLENVHAFLSLVGFIALFLGAIGVASAVNVHIREKIPTVAVLRCLGATAGRSFAVYLVQGLGLGLAGALLGAGLGAGVQLALPALARDFLPFEVALSVSWSAVAGGMAAGLVICALFTLLPLLPVRRVSPLLALRADYGEHLSARDPLRWTVFALIGLAVLGFALWQTGRWDRGAGFAMALAAGLGALAGVARLAAWMARRWFPRRLPYVWRQGAANLHRPRNRTVLLLVSLGLGTFLVLTLQLARESLLREFGGSTGEDRPNLMFFDIQDDQLAGVEAALLAAGAPARQTAPIVTMRISALKGRPVREILGSARRRDDEHVPGWTLRREYRSTYRGRLTDTEKVVAGRFTGRVAAGEEIVPVSLERDLAKDMQVKLGDEITFDVQGVPVRTRVASLREVEWQRLQPNFFVVFPEGVLEAAPKFHLVAARASSPAHSAAVQQAVVRGFPNVSAIDLGLVLQTLDGVFDKVSAVVSFLAVFVLGTGVLVLAGAVLSSRYQRVRESVLLRTLGASRRQIRTIMLVEYASLGALAGITGCALAVAANWILARTVFETRPAAPPLLLLGAVVAVTALTLITGLLSSRGVGRHPPLEILRQEA